MAQPLILDQSRATGSSLDRAASTQLIGTPSLQVFSPSHHLKKLAIILELTGMASSSGLRARSLTLITLSLRHSARPRCCPARDWALASAGEQRGTRERFEIVVPSCEEESPPVCLHPWQSCPSPPSQDLNLIFFQTDLGRRNRQNRGFFHNHRSRSLTQY